MDLSEQLPIDILAYITEELQGLYRGAKNNSEQIEKVFQEFLERWNSDASLNKVKAIKLKFKEDLDWFNVTTRLSFEKLKGKLVILDFFTYCCINCMHVLPELHNLENRFPVESGLVIVGVHSPKFDNEKNSSKLLLAVQRYNIKHPIVNDSHSTLWNTIGIRCWPSLVVLSPDGEPILLLMGEGNGTFLEQFIEIALKFFDKKLKRSQMDLIKSTSTKPLSNMRFPAKIVRSPQQHYAVADSGNNRILIFDENGLVHHKIGGNEPGFIDGSFAVARFNSPQGVAFLNENILIVADTENHALRQITLSESFVETLAGTGHQGNDQIGGRQGPLQPLSSPWDVEIYRTRDMDMSFHLDERNVPEKTIILIAMAGTHQIWGYFPEGIIWWKFRKYEPQCCAALIGNGLEENRNNSYPQNAAFAQPSGLTMAKDFLYIADSESSSIRKASMVEGKVMPVVGGDRNPLNLFAFGDVDGKQFNAKLQHPLDVEYDHVNEKIYVADTYNNKIKAIDPVLNQITTLLVKNEFNDFLTLNEPAGICVSNDSRYLLVADTNNHEIQKVDLKSGIAQAMVFDFSQLNVVTETDFATRANNFTLVKKTIFWKANLKINAEIILANGLTFTKDAPQKWTVKYLHPLFYAKQNSGNVTGGKFCVQVHRQGNNNADNPLNANEVVLRLDIVVSLCDVKCCLLKRFEIVFYDSTLESLQKINENINIYIDHLNIRLT